MPQLVIYLAFPKPEPIIIYAYFEVFFFYQLFEIRDSCLFYWH